MPNTHEPEDILDYVSEKLMDELDLEIDKSEPESPDNAMFVVPREIKSEIGTSIMVIDFIHDLSGKCFDADANDENPFLDGDMMKAMIRELPEQELSVMVRGLVDPVLRSLAEEALAEIARQARTTWKKRMGREVITKSRPRERWKQ